MAREIALSFALGARLQSGFTATFRSASDQAKAVSQSLRDMERTPVAKVGAQRTKIRELSESLKEARGELDNLWQRASQAGTMTTIMARQIEQAERRVRTCTGALNRQTAAYRESLAQVAQTRGSVRGLAAEYGHLSAQMDRARAVQTAMAANRSQAGTACRSAGAPAGHRGRRRHGGHPGQAGRQCGRCVR